MVSAKAQRAGSACSQRPRVLGVGLLGAACWVLSGAAAAADWLPVSAEELQMRSEPKAPEAPGRIRRCTCRSIRTTWDITAMSTNASRS